MYLMEDKMAMHSIKSLTLILALAISLVACSSPDPSIDSDNTTVENNEGVNNGGSNLNSQENKASEDSNETGSTEPDETEKMDLALLFLDDATNISIEEDYVSFVTTMSLDALIDFYKIEMEAYGYTLGTEVVVADNVVLRFVKGSAAIRIVTNRDGMGGFFVVIAYDE